MEPARRSSNQLSEARRLRVEQAQPYAIAYTEQSAAAEWIVDLVVRNFGTTAAHHIRLEITPAPRSTTEQDNGEIWLPESIPVLVPGHEWRTLWDIGHDRFAADLPRRHEAVVAIRDSQGKALAPLRSVLDWDAYYGRHQVTVYGTHHAAKALRGIEKSIGRWGEGKTARGLAVVARDGDAKDRRLQERLEARRAEPNANGDERSE